MILLLVCTGLYSHAQHYSSLRYRYLQISDSTVQLDTMLIAPETFFLISPSGDTLSSGTYTLDPVAGTVRILPGMIETMDSLVLVVYRVYPLSIKKEYYDEALKPEPEVKNPADRSYLYSPLDRREESQEGYLSFGELQKSGSISRSVTIGTNQDAVLNSAMNLQLSGELAPGISIVAAITDNTIPIQPEGNSQQIREFDKVFIRASGKHWETTAGDFDLTQAPGDFLRFSKKVKGAMYAGEWAAGSLWKMSSKVAGAVARGKYATNRFNGIEGNQGPYQLQGADHESFIMVLAGSEKVFLDGRLLVRGANNDYVIDYNAAQIIFTSKVPVTKDKRFEIMFEYAERYFNRSLFYLQQQAVRGKKLTLGFQYYREQDISGQPLNQEQLLEDNHELLRSIGDNIATAVVPNIKQVPFNNSEVLYKKTDTLVNGTLYSPVYIYSTSSDSALWRLGFSYVGKGNGQYIQTSNAANGKVFLWVAPEAGKWQGDYEPVILLVTPKSQQMATLSGSWEPNSHVQIFIESAVSGNDLNTFSSFDDDNNAGMALSVGARHRCTPGGDSSAWRLESELQYRMISPGFTQVERFREVEYERDWNITGASNFIEHQGKVQIKTIHQQLGYLQYIFEPLLRGPDEQALRHSAQLQIAKGRWILAGKVSMLNNRNTLLPSKFLRHQVLISRKQGLWSFSALHEGEDNQQYTSDKDSLISSSFWFDRWQMAIERGDTARILFKINGGRRTDRLPGISAFNPNSGNQANEINAGIASARIPDHRFDISIGYRKLNYRDTATVNGPEENLLSRIEYNHRFFRGLIRGTLFYEFGSGLEYKKDFTYLEVPSGQGIYTWKDFNGDSIKQLDEFEVAVFQDQATYIRVYTPTQQYVRVYTMQYNQSVQIEPAALLKNETRWGKFLSRFSDQGNYRMEHKCGGEDMLSAMDPWFADYDNPLLYSLNSNLRNTVYFNRSGTHGGIDYTTQINQSRVLMVNGFESRSQIQHALRCRLTIGKNLLLRAEGNTGTRNRMSEFFINNNYLLTLWSSSAELQYQPGTQYKLSLKYQFSQKENTTGASGEKASIHRTTSEFRFNMPQKGSLQAQAEMIIIGYNAPPQTSIAFEMLEGLTPGNNFTWTLSYQRVVASNMQIGIQYNGRKSTGIPMVHTGNVQVRAFF
jgi:hypothetical protein